MVREGAQQMGRLIDELLLYARLGRQSLRMEPVSIDELVHRCLDELRPTIAGQDVRIEVGDLPSTRGDPVLLKQAFQNLLDNAIKYTRLRDPALIEVGSLQVDGGDAYFVRDNGVGFEMAYADKLFGVFQRLHGADEYEGTGVGLAIVQRAVHRHGGRVWAESEIDRGTTFYLTLGGGDPSDAEPG
jgi:light-regulated signal transduction histidine kinase (bacteriophytochrome)